MTLEMYVELLLRRLDLGFLRFAPSLLADEVKSMLSPPKKGDFPGTLEARPCELAPLRWRSCESPDPLSLPFRSSLSVLDLGLPL